MDVASLKQQGAWVRLVTALLQLQPVQHTVNAAAANGCMVSRFWYGLQQVLAKSHSSAFASHSTQGQLPSPSDLDAGRSSAAPCAQATGSRRVKPDGSCATTTSTPSVAGAWAHPASLQLKRAYEPSHPSACRWQAWRQLGTKTSSQTSITNTSTVDTKTRRDRPKRKQRREEALGPAQASPDAGHTQISMQHSGEGSQIGGRGLFRDPAAMETIAASGLPANMKAVAIDAQRAIAALYPHPQPGQQVSPKQAQAILALEGAMETHFGRLCVRHAVSLSNTLLALARHVKAQHPCSTSAPLQTEHLPAPIPKLLADHPQVDKLVAGLLHGTIPLPFDSEKAMLLMQGNEQDLKQVVQLVKPGMELQGSVKNVEAVLRETSWGAILKKTKEGAQRALSKCTEACRVLDAGPLHSPSAINASGEKASPSTLTPVASLQQLEAVRQELMSGLELKLLPLISMLEMKDPHRGASSGTHLPTTPVLTQPNQDSHPMEVHKEGVVKRSETQQPSRQESQPSPNYLPTAAGSRQHVQQEQGAAATVASLADAGIVQQQQQQPLKEPSQRHEQGPLRPKASMQVNSAGAGVRAVTDNGYGHDGLHRVWASGLFRDPAAMQLIAASPLPSAIKEHALAAQSAVAALHKRAEGLARSGQDEAQASATQETIQALEGAMEVKFATRCEQHVFCVFHTISLIADYYKVLLDGLTIQEAEANHIPAAAALFKKYPVKADLAVGLLEGFIPPVSSDRIAVSMQRLERQLRALTAASKEAVLGVEEARNSSVKAWRMAREAYWISRDTHRKPRGAHQKPRGAYHLSGSFTVSKYQETLQVLAECCERAVGDAAGDDGTTVISTKSKLRPAAPSLHQVQAVRQALVQACEQQYRPLMAAIDVRRPRDASRLASDQMLLATVQERGSEGMKRAVWTEQGQVLADQQDYDQQQGLDLNIALGTAALSTAALGAAAPGTATALPPAAKLMKNLTSPPAVKTPGTGGRASLALVAPLPPPPPPSPAAAAAPTTTDKEEQVGLDGHPLHPLHPHPAIKLDIMGGALALPVRATPGLLTKVRQWSDSIELGLPMGVVKLHRDAITAQVKEMLGVITAAAGRDGMGCVVPSPASTTTASTMTASGVGSGRDGRLYRAPLPRGVPQPPASVSASASGVTCSPRAAKAQLWALLRAAAHPRSGDEQLLMILSLCMEDQPLWLQLEVTQHVAASLTHSGVAATTPTTPPHPGSPTSPSPTGPRPVKLVTLPQVSGHTPPRGQQSVAYRQLLDQLDMEVTGTPLLQVTPHQLAQLAQLFSGPLQAHRGQLQRWLVHRVWTSLQADIHAHTSTGLDSQAQARPHLRSRTEQQRQQQRWSADDLAHLLIVSQHTPLLDESLLRMAIEHMGHCLIDKLDPDLWPQLLPALLRLCHRAMKQSGHTPTLAAAEWAAVGSMLRGTLALVESMRDRLGLEAAVMPGLVEEPLLLLRVPGARQLVHELLTKPASDTTAIKGGHLTRCLSMLLLHSPRLPEHPALAAHAPASMRGTTQHMSPSRRAWGAEKEEAGDGRGLGGREVEAAPDPRFWLRSRQAKFRSSSSRSSSNMEQAATDLVAAICGRMQAGLADMSTDELVELLEVVSGGAGPSSGSGLFVALTQHHLLAPMTAMVRQRVQEFEPVQLTRLMVAVARLPGANCSIDGEANDDGDAQGDQRGAWGVWGAGDVLLPLLRQRLLRLLPGCGLQQLTGVAQVLGSGGVMTWSADHGEEIGEGGASLSMLRPQGFAHWDYALSAVPAAGSARGGRACLPSGIMTAELLDALCKSAEAELSLLGTREDGGGAVADEGGKDKRKKEALETLNDTVQPQQEPLQQEVSQREVSQQEVSHQEVSWQGASGINAVQAARLLSAFSRAGILHKPVYDAVCSQIAASLARAVSEGSLGTEAARNRDDAVAGSGHAFGGGSRGGWGDDGGGLGVVEIREIMRSLLRVGRAEPVVADLAARRLTQLVTAEFGYGEEPGL